MAIIAFISTNPANRTSTSTTIRTASIVIESINSKSDSHSDQSIIDYCMPS